MKFDPFEWQEIVTGQEIPGKPGGFRLVLSKPAAVYITAQGYEALLGFGAVFDVKIATEYTYRVEPAEYLRAFTDTPPDAHYEPEGEVFTNADRLAMESGAVAEVTRALRLLKIEQRRAMDEIRAARRQSRDQEQRDLQDDDTDGKDVDEEKTERKVERKAERQARKDEDDEGGDE